MKSNGGEANDRLPAADAGRVRVVPRIKAMQIMASVVLPCRAGISGVNAKPRGRPAAAGIIFHTSGGVLTQVNIRWLSRNCDV